MALVTAMNDVWALSQTDPNPDHVAEVAGQHQHLGFGVAETHPCPCQFCGGIVAHHPPLSALEAGANMPHSDDQDGSGYNPGPGGLFGWECWGVWFYEFDHDTIRPIYWLYSRWAMYEGVA